MLANELLQRYAEGKRDFTGANLYGADLQGANLYGANLRGANLRGADLQGANLHGANLCGANLWGANLRDANLRGANLWGANLRDANLRSADLQGANLYGADLQGANLQGADLQGANLRGADLQGAEIADGKIITGYFTRTRIGSASGELQIAYNDTEIWLRRGCSGWLTPDEFLSKVSHTHDNNLHAKIYRVTVAHIIKAVALERQLQAVQPE